MTFYSRYSVTTTQEIAGSFPAVSISIEIKLGDYLSEVNIKIPKILCLAKPLKLAVIPNFFGTTLTYQHREMRKIAHSKKE